MQDSLPLFLAVTAVTKPLGAVNGKILCGRQADSETLWSFEGSIGSV